MAQVDSIQVPGMDPVSYQSVGNTSHSTALEARGDGWHVQYALVLDDAMESALVPIRVDVGRARSPVDVHAVMRAGLEVVRSMPREFLFLTLGRAEMDHKSILREIDGIARRQAEDGDRSGPAFARRAETLECLRSRATDLGAAAEAIHRWCGAPRDPVPTVFAASREVVAPIPLAEGGDPAEATRTAIVEALRDGEAVAGLALGSPTRAAEAAVRAAAELGLGKVSFVSFRDDPTGGGHKAVVAGTSWPMAPVSLAWMARDGVVGSGNLLIVETTPPTDVRLREVLRQLGRHGVDPVVLAFDTSSVMVGRASALAATLDAPAPSAPTP